MAAWFAEDGDEEVGCAVDHGGAVGESRDAVDEAVQLEDLPDAGEVSQVGLGYGEEVAGADAGGVLPVGDVALRPDFAGVGHLPVKQADCAGEVEKVAGLEGREVVSC